MTSSNSKSKRGFATFVGKTIVKINTRACNVVRVHFTDGTVYDIDGEEKFIGIPIITARKVKKSELQ